MPEIVYSQEEGEPIQVNLRDPYWAAIMAWLWPGAGHLYQRRYAKGLLFMICILSTFVFGLGLGRGRVVYTRFHEDDFRWHYLLQMGVGLPAFPAIVQSMKTAGGGDPYFVLCERYPADYPVDSMRFHKVNEDEFPDAVVDKTLKDGFMAPPPGPPDKANELGVLGMWHYDYKHMFEMGTLYTIVAGLLNLLAIYDAFVGPAVITPLQRERMEKKKKTDL